MFQVLLGNNIEVLKTLGSDSIHCVVTSPPYFFLREYSTGERSCFELGQNSALDCMGWARGYSCNVCYICQLVNLFREVKRILHSSGTVFLNLGDSFANPKIRSKLPLGIKGSELLGVPWRVAFALQQDGWILRQEIIFEKRNPLPESVRDRCTKSHETIFLLSKNRDYFFDNEAIKEPAAYFGKRDSAKKGSFVAKGEPLPGQLPFRAIVEKRNRHSVWNLVVEHYRGGHFATFPIELPRLCILAGTSEKGCCADCSSPYIRKSKIIGRQVTEQMRKCGGDVNGDYSGNDLKEYSLNKVQTPGSTKKRILESLSQVKEFYWEKSCLCSTEEIKPCVVLDPFVGSGTVLGVSESLGRDSIGIELNPDYISLIEPRVLAIKQKLSKVKKKRKVGSSKIKQLTLFSEDDFK